MNTQLFYNDTEYRVLLDENKFKECTYPILNTYSDTAITLQRKSCPCPCMCVVLVHIDC